MMEFDAQTIPRPVVLRVLRVLGVQGGQGLHSEDLTIDKFPQSLRSPRLLENTPTALLESCDRWIQMDQTQVAGCV